MKKFRGFLRDTPWLVWAATAIGLLAYVGGLRRLPGGEELERLVNTGKLATLLFGILALRWGVSKETGHLLWISAGLLLLALFAGITLAAWFIPA